jgi:hypothetical protein
MRATWILVLGLALPVGAQQPGQPTAGPPRAGHKKAGGLDLARLKELDHPKLTAGARLQVALRLYRAEMLDPTPRPGPPYTDPKTHDYVLAQITERLVAGEVDVPALRKLWEAANPGEVRDCLALALGLKGEPAVKEALAALVVDRQRPLRLRELAARAVGILGVRTQDPKLGEVLAQVIREDVQGQYKLLPPASGKGPQEMGMVFPVRRAAVEGIRKMQKADLLLASYVVTAAERAQTEIRLPADARKRARPVPEP